MRWAVVLVGALLCVWLVAMAEGAEEKTVIELWPDGAPGAEAAAQPEKAATQPWRGHGTITRLTNVSKPTITVFRPKKPAATGAAVVVCPGGGYGILAYDLEGTEVCQWLNGLGITGILLKYRVPRQRDGASQDAQRALGLVRARAKEWGIEPRRIGVLGFSAGGHLAARLCTNFETRAYKAVDAADTMSCRPDFAILIYPAYMAKGAGLDTATLPVSKQTPTTFVAIACNDRFTSGALAYFGALRKAKVRSELHVFQIGGHGCGLRKIDDGLTTWPAHCERWMRGAGVLAR